MSLECCGLLCAFYLLVFIHLFLTNDFTSGFCLPGAGSTAQFTSEGDLLKGLGLLKEAIYNIYILNRNAVALCIKVLLTNIMYCISKTFTSKL